MDLFSFDWASLFTLQNLLAVVLGGVFGMIIGALPGLGPTVGCALLIPITYKLDAIPAVLMLMSLYMSSQYGGSITSILLGIPGTPGAVATVLDGNPIAKAGYPGKALGYSLYASTVGGLFGVAVLFVLTKPLAVVAVKLSDPELVLIGIIGIMSVAALGSENPWKCAVSVVLGLLLGTIGLDKFAGSYRYTFGNVYLGEGLSLVTLLGGFFALSEVFEMCIGDLSKRYVTNYKNLKCHVSLKEFFEQKFNLLRSSVIGTVFGIIPGLGGGAATWFAYTQAKNSSKKPELFGNGSPEGLSAAESSNNAAVGGGMVPALALGIPGTAAISIVMCVLMSKGIQPGPNLFNSNPTLVYCVYWGLLFATIVMFVFGKYLTSFFAKILVCPNYVLCPIIVAMLLIGAAVDRGYIMDIWMAVAAGVLVFFLKRLEFSLTAFTLAFVLAGLIEERFRRSLLLSQGSFSIFFNRPLAIVLWILMAVMLISIVRNNRKKSAENAKTKPSV